MRETLNRAAPPVHRTSFGKDKTLAEIVPLARIDAGAVETLLDRAFGADRFTRTAYRLRAGTVAIPGLSFAMIDSGGTLLGTIQCWPVRLARPQGDVPLVMVGPVAVEPGHQRGGIGRTLMEAMLAAAARDDSPALMMIGDPEYYGRFFGFTAEPTSGWAIDGPVERRRLLALPRANEALPETGEILPRV